MVAKANRQANDNPSRVSARLWAILGVVLLADVLDLMDGSITNIAAPSIVHSIGGGESLIKWLGAGYALAIGTLLVVGGRLGDRYGKRKLFLIGIAGFTVASLLCGLAVNPATMVAGRLLQGGFGALLIPQGMSILLAAFSPKQLPMVFSAFSMTLGLSAILGPIVAGLMISANLLGLHWRPVFLINIALGIVGYFAASKLLPHDKPTSRERIDAIGAGILGVMMLALIYGLIQGPAVGWTLGPVASLVVGGLALIGFIIRQRVAANPIIKPSLVKKRSFLSGLIVGLGYFAATSGMFYVFSLFLQLNLRYTPVHASIAMTPMMLGLITASFGTRPLLAKYGRGLVVAGLSVTLVGAAVLFATIMAQGLGISIWLLAPTVFLLGLGLGTSFSTIFTVTVGEVAHDEVGSASGSLSAIQQLATAIGSAVITTVYFKQLQNHDGAYATLVSVATAASIVLLCFGLVGLMPKKAAVEDQSEMLGQEMEL